MLGELGGGKLRTEEGGHVVVYEHVGGAVGAFIRRINGIADNKHAAMTIGNVILSTRAFAMAWQSDCWLSAHERAPVTQANLLGSSYLVAYLAGLLPAWIRSQIEANPKLAHDAHFIEWIATQLANEREPLPN